MQKQPQTGDHVQARKRAHQEANRPGTLTLDFGLQNLEESRPVVKPPAQGALVQQPRLTTAEEPLTHRNVIKSWRNTPIISASPVGEACERSGDGALGGRRNGAEGLFEGGQVSVASHGWGPSTRPQGGRTGCRCDGSEQRREGGSRTRKELPAERRGQATWGREGAGVGGVWGGSWGKLSVIANSSPKDSQVVSRGR